MRRLSLLAPLLIVLLVGLVVVGWGGSTTFALEGTPTTDASAPPEGVSFTALGFGTADQLPATPADFVVARFTLDPGASFPIEASDPSVTLATVESGVFTFKIEAAITVTRAATIAAFADPNADQSSIAPPEEMTAGTAFTMEAGDSAYFPGNIAGEVRNDGQEPAVALLAILEPSGGGEAGTPTP